MNPLAMAGMPGMTGGLSDSSTTASGDVNGKNQNGAAVNFGGGWESMVPVALICVTALVALYIWKK